MDEYELGNNNMLNLKNTCYSLNHVHLKKTKIIEKNRQDQCPADKTNKQ